MSSAVSPLIGASCGGVWDSANSENSVKNLGPVGSPRPTGVIDKEARSKLYYHLAAVFPEDQVRRAMAALPEETDPQTICKYILYLNNANQQSSSS
jgi:hypothetical protein